jgi:hypothetical protein
VDEPRPRAPGKRRRDPIAGRLSLRNRLPARLDQKPPRRRHAQGGTGIHRKNAGPVWHERPRAARQTRVYPCTERSLPPPHRRACLCTRSAFAGQTSTRNRPHPESALPPRQHGSP